MRVDIVSPPANSGGFQSLRVCVCVCARVRVFVCVCVYVEQIKESSRILLRTAQALLHKIQET